MTMANIMVMTTAMETVMAMAKIRGATTNPIRTN
jgi:hypothetical protein